MSTVSDAATRLSELIELKAREAWLGFQKTALKIRRLFR
jgi:hypothetical protein